MTPTPLTPEELAKLERLEAAIRSACGSSPGEFYGADLDKVLDAGLLHDVARLVNAAPALIAAARRLGEVESERNEAEGHCNTLHQLLNLREEVGALMAGQLTDANARVAELEAEHEAAWGALGISREDRDANDDPDCETLAQCVAVSIQYERDMAELKADAATARAAAAERKVEELREAWRARAAKGGE